MLGLLFEHGGLNAADDAQDLSRKLHLPIAKVKSLLYELHLRDESKGEDWVIAELSQRLRQSKPLVSGSGESARIDVGIDNQLLRVEVEALLKRNGHYPDYSFNREILRLSPNAYAALIKAVLPNVEYKALLALLKKSAKGSTEEKNENNWLPMVVRQVIVHAAGTFGDGVGDMSVEAVRAGVMLLIDSGAQIFS